MKTIIKIYKTGSKNPVYIEEMFFLPDVSDLVINEIEQKTKGITDTKKIEIEFEEDKK